MSSKSDSFPIVTITEPFKGAYVEDTITIKGTAQAASGNNITKVNVSIDYISWDEAICGIGEFVNWQYDWDTTTVENGEHMIIAQSWDNEDHTSVIHYIDVIVDNNEPPEVTITKPEEDETVNGEYEIKGTITDVDSIEDVEIKINNSAYMDVDNFEGMQVLNVYWFNYSWDTTEAENGEHTIQVRAYDGENWGNSSVRTVTVNNQGDDLIGYWSFDEGSETVAYDSSGKGHNGDIYGAVLSEETPFESGYSLYFDYDGYNPEYVDVPVNGEDLFEFNDESLSYSVWVKILDDTNSNEYYNFISLGENTGYNSGDNFPHIGLTKDKDWPDDGGYDGSIYYEIEQTPETGDEPAALSNDNRSAFYDGKWHFIVGVIEYDDTPTIKLYVDGMLQDHTESINSYDLGEIDNELHLHFGKGCGGWEDNIGYHKGYLDDIRIYSKALDGPEIQELYEQRESLMAYWSFDDGTATDDSGNGNDGELWGPVETDGYSGLAFDFDGVDDKITVSDDPSLNFNDVNEFSLGLWVKRAAKSSGESEGLICKSTGGETNAGYRLFINNDDTASLEIRDGGPPEGYDLFSDLTIDANKWYHIVGTWDGTKSSLYINGDPDNSETFSGVTISDDEKDLELGNHWGPHPFAGIIDEVFIYNRALDGQEIQELYEEYTGESDLLSIEYDDPRCCYKYNDTIRIFANYSDIFPGAIGNVYITIKNVDGNTIINNNQMNKTEKHQYYDWVVPEGNDGNAIVNITAYNDVGSGIMDQTWDASKRIDNTKPIFMYITDTAGYDYATVHWLSDEEVNGLVEYGPETTYGSTMQSSNTVAKHDVTIPNLLHNTTYHYKITTTDFAGNTNSSSDHTFKTSSEKEEDNESKEVKADAGGPYNASINESITFDGSKSYSEAGTIVWYRWDFENDGVYDTTWSVTPTTDHIYTSVGSHTVKLQVEDNKRNIGSDTASVAISEAYIEEIGNLTEGNLTKIDIEDMLDTIIISIEIEPTQSLSNVELTIVDRGDYKPDNIIEPPNLVDLLDDPNYEKAENLSVYRYVDITLKSNDTYVEESKIKKAFVIFKVDQEWIQNNEINHSTINLMRYNNEDWQKLNTVIIDEEEDYLYFTAETPGLSTFAVIGSKIVESPKKYEEPEIPWIVIIGFVISAIVLLIFILFKAKLIYIAEIPEE